MKKKWIDRQLDISALLNKRSFFLLGPRQTGKTSLIHHKNIGVFKDLPNPYIATRYHSLVALEESLPKELVVTASSLEDHYVMGVRHTGYPIEGVQFHPESILSREGDMIIRNFLRGREVAI